MVHPLLLTVCPIASPSDGVRTIYIPSTSTGIVLLGCNTKHEITIIKHAYLPLKDADS